MDEARSTNPNSGSNTAPRPHVPARLDTIPSVPPAPGHHAQHASPPLPGPRRAAGPAPLALALTLLPLAAAACVPRDRTGFDAIGPSHRLDAIVLAADQADDPSLQGLIQQLDSDDPAARLLAIRALEKRTGQTLDYRYDDPPWKRDAAVNRWMLWYQARDGVAPSGAGPMPTQEGP